MTFVSKILTWVQPLLIQIQEIATTWWSNIQAAWTRHVERLETDTSYQRTVVDAVAAVIRTVITRTTVAAAIVVAVTTIIVPTTATTGDPEDFDEPEESYPPPWQKPRPGSLWDRYNTDWISGNLDI